MVFVLVGLQEAQPENVRQVTIESSILLSFIMTETQLFIV